MTYVGILEMLSVRRKHDYATKHKAVGITKDEHDQLRYNHPKFGIAQNQAKVPSQELNNYLVKTLNKT